MCEGVQGRRRRSSPGSGGGTGAVGGTTAADGAASGVGVTPGTDLAAAEAIHHRIHEVCFIARSVNFPVDYAPGFTVAASGGDI